MAEGTQRPGLSSFFVHRKYLIFSRPVTCVGARGPHVYHRKHQLLVYLARIQRQNVQEISVSNVLETNCAASTSHRSRRLGYLVREPQGLEVLQINKKAPQRRVLTALSTANSVHYLLQDVTVSRASVKSPSPPQFHLYVSQNIPKPPEHLHTTPCTRIHHSQTEQQAVGPHQNIRQTSVDKVVLGRVATLELENAALANRYRLQNTLSRWNARHISDSDFRTRMQEHLAVLDDLASRHIEDFPTDYEDGIQLMANHDAPASHSEHEDNHLETGPAPRKRGRK
ncbi:hypothetical protein DFS33DRAFT_1278312 [Desarmillaria ectypa]|nr:hypothetical protein DFS33DRAFT_1278312 [Desarmillaria ectypa]